MRRQPVHDLVRAGGAERLDPAGERIARPERLDGRRPPPHRSLPAGRCEDACPMGRRRCQRSAYARTPSRAPRRACRPASRVRRGRCPDRAADRSARDCRRPRRRQSRRPRATQGGKPSSARVLAESRRCAPLRDTSVRCADATSHDARHGDARRRRSPALQAGRPTEDEGRRSATEGARGATMGSPALVGLDVGTTGVKAVAISPEGNVLAVASRGYRLSTPRRAGRSRTRPSGGAQRSPRSRRCPTGRR